MNWAGMTVADAGLWSLLFSREVIAYVLAGAATTLVNLAVFELLRRIFGKDRWYKAQLPAIVAAILFAFVVNRAFVFQSTGPFWSEMWKFIASRIGVSLVLEYGFMYLLYNVCKLKSDLRIIKWDVSVSKLITQLLVLTSNYLISKLFIFKTGV